MSSTQQRISLRKAAELIFRTSKPTDEQVRRVMSLISVGELAGTSRGTTADAVADFIARTALERKRAGRAGGCDPDQRDAAKIDRVYRTTLKQYFLAVILRRKVAGASRNFQRAVMAGQVAVLLAAVAIVFAAARTIAAPTAPEKVAVQAWLEQNASRWRIIRWHPPQVDDDGKMRMRVQYHYVTSAGRGVDTDRTFTISSGHVVSVDQE